MTGKKIGEIITIVVSIPTLFALAVWSSHIAQNPGNISNINEGVQIIAADAIPWWLDILQWLAGWPGIIGMLLVIGFILFVRWTRTY